MSPTFTSCGLKPLRARLCEALQNGWGGIRTHGTLTSTPVFKTGAFNRSATHPTISFNPLFYVFFCGFTITAKNPQHTSRVERSDIIQHRTKKIAVENHAAIFHQAYQLRYESSQAEFSLEIERRSGLQSYHFIHCAALGSDGRNVARLSKT
jgi:hypothetical protein